MKQKPKENLLYTYRKPLLRALLVAVVYGALCFSADILMLALIIAWTFFLVFPALLLIFIYQIFRRNRYKQISVVLVALAIVAGFVIGAKVYRTTEDLYWKGNGGTDMSRANAIIAAVKAYEKDTGNFPAKLDELVPKYLDSVPKTVKGTDYGYSRGQSASNCLGAPYADGTYAPGMCQPGKWSFHMTFMGYRYHMCYEYGHDYTATGSSEMPWGMCDVL